ncbi:uncharacterized protein ARMOST_11102 [Armillaria ostoyae]|uniref:Uncharacterized protein n=1 Tax=Armillaria ostoyae TaxID=47428 RepID=A0A284RG84_ARMOS|nr:uncharacterized protein ARMOST_11102 [Armillaria ostoyae]
MRGAEMKSKFVHLNHNSNETKWPVKQPMPSPGAFKCDSPMPFTTQFYLLNILQWLVVLGGLDHPAHLPVACILRKEPFRVIPLE